MGNGEAKELLYVTHGHELRWGNDGGSGGTGWKGIKERKNGTTMMSWPIKHIKFFFKLAKLIKSFKKDWTLYPIISLLGHHPK